MTGCVTAWTKAYFKVIGVREFQDNTFGIIFRGIL